MTRKANGAAAPGRSDRDAADNQVNPSTPPIAAVTVSDRTCMSVLGIEWRVLRRWLDEKGVHYSRIGRRPIVRVAAVLDALDGGVSDWDEDAVVARAAKGGSR